MKPRSATGAARGLALAFLFALSACGGGAHAVPPAAAGTAGTGTPHGASAQGTARFTLTIPTRGIPNGKARAPQYVSASTLSAAITANPGGVVTSVDLGAASPLCQAVSGGRACSIPVAAPIGTTDTFSLLLYDGPCTGGPPCVPTGNVLSGASSFGPIAVTEGQSNVTVPLVLGGVPTAVDVAASGLASGQAVTVPLTVTAYDADGNIIVGPAAYADATGAAAPLTVALRIVPYNNQVTLHDGAQNGTTIAIAAPTDTPTVQLTTPANVIGIPFVVTTPALATLPAHTSQTVALSGTLTATLLATSISDQPDYTLYAPMNVNSASGMVNGFVFDFGTESGGGYIGFFNSNAVPENLNYCSVSSQFDAGVAPIDGGVAFAYAANLFTDTTPWGLNWLPRADFASGACPAGTPYETDTLGTPGSVVRSMAYDPVGHELFTGGDTSITDGGSGVTVNPSLRYESFSGAALSADTILANNLANPIISMINTNNRRFYLIGSGASVLYTQSGISAPSSTTIAGTNLVTVVGGYDGRAYALDVANKTVYAWNGTSAPVRYTAGAFVNTPPGRQWQLAIGPDGTAFADNGTRTVESLPTSGTSTSVTIPTMSGNGTVDALFDGTNGYVYAVVNDGVDNSTMNVVRISR